MNSQHFESVGTAKKTADTRVKCSGDMCDGLTLKREEECPRSHLHSEEKKQTSLVYIGRTRGCTGRKGFQVGGSIG